MATAAPEMPSSPAPSAPRHTLRFEQPLAKLEQQISELEALQATKQLDYTAELRQLRDNYTALLKKTYDNLTAWETVDVARHPQRPQFRDYVELCCREFFREIHGDRRYADDKAIVAGLARFGGTKVMLIGHHKGRDTKERIACCFGSAHPEGYRKALRAMKLAEKFGLPVVTLIDTAGAYPGLGSEERGVAEAIAVNMMEMSRLRTPIVSVITGEGGSGGAIGLAVADRVSMLEHAWYSVISPEGASGILWKRPDIADAAEASAAASKSAAAAAAALKLTSRDLKQLGIIDHVIPEPLGGAHRDPHQAAHTLDQYVMKTLRDLKRYKIDNLLERRYEKFRSMGEYQEKATRAAKAG